MHSTDFPIYLTSVMLQHSNCAINRRHPSYHIPFALTCFQRQLGGTLDGSNITVTSETDHVDEPSTGDHPIDQTDKPRAGIAAEYLAKGYVLSDQILQRAIDLDQKQGISTRFLNYLKHFDTTVGQKVFKPESEGGPHPTVSGKVTSTVKSLDEQRGISKTATDVRH